MTTTKTSFVKFISFNYRSCNVCGSENVGESGDGLFCWDCRSYQ